MIKVRIVKAKQYKSEKQRSAKMNTQELKDIVEKDGVIINPFYDRGPEISVMQNFPNPAARPTPHKSDSPPESDIISITPAEEASILGVEESRLDPALNEKVKNVQDAHQRSNKFLEERLRKKLEEKK